MFTAHGWLCVCMDVWMKGWMYGWMCVKVPAALSPLLILLTLPTSNFKQQSSVGFTSMGSVFPYREWAFSLPCLFFLPDSPIYWPEQLREGLWRDINEKKHTESPAGTWTQEKREYKLFQEGIAFVSQLHVTCALACCRILTQNIGTRAEENGLSRSLCITVKWCEFGSASQLFTLLWIRPDFILDNRNVQHMIYCSHSGCLPSQQFDTYLIIFFVI